MRVLVKFFVGILFSFLFISLLGGGFSNAFGLIALSIICTGGAGLVFWLPVWYVIGSVVYTVVKANIKSEKAVETVDQPAQSLTNDQKALINYIQQSRNLGVSDDIIASNLHYNGWAENAITEAFKLTEKQKA